MGKDFWGGMFDFNGDGKTTWDEELLGFSLLEEQRKRADKEPSHNAKAPKVKIVHTIREVPEIVDETNYKSLCREYRAECISNMVALVLALIPAVAVLWAVYSAYDPQNSASDFMTVFFTLAGLFYGGVVLHSTGKSINICMKNLSLVKERYVGPELPKEKGKIRWLLLLLIPLIIGSYFLFSSKEDNDNQGYNDSEYDAPTYSEGYGTECCLRHCDFKAKEGSPYCSRHGCCKDGCRNRKDPMVHCCDTHNCAEPGCGLHRYDYADSMYCTTHYLKHYND